MAKQGAGLMTITIDTLAATDLAGILALQEANLRDNLDEQQQREGYLSIGFTGDQFQAFHDDLAVVIARDEGQVIAYCCVSSAAFNAQFPILDQIIAQLPGYRVPGNTGAPALASACIWGPACIDKVYRGTGVLDKLFDRAATLARQAGYGFCFSFVSRGNPRSLTAHLKLPFREVGAVTHNGNEFAVIGCCL